MEFLTLHELSLQFDIPVRVLRYRLRHWLLAGELVEGVDYRRDDYVDENHFIWRISPLALIRVTGRHPVARPGNQMPPVVTQLVNPPLPALSPQAYQTLPNLDKAAPGLEREMIDLLKDQVRVKDIQISDLTEQNKTVNSLNLKLTARIVQQDDKVQELLRLTGGKTEVDDLVTKVVDPVVTQGANLGTNGQPLGNQVGNEEEGGAVAA